MNGTRDKSFQNNIQCKNFFFVLLLVGLLEKSFIIDSFYVYPPFYVFFFGSFPPKNIRNISWERNHLFVHLTRVLFHCMANWPFNNRIFNQVILKVCSRQRSALAADDYKQVLQHLYLIILLPPVAAVHLLSHSCTSFNIIHFFGNYILGRKTGVTSIQVFNTGLE